jgi:hypothetical protein
MPRNNNPPILLSVYTLHAILDSATVQQPRHSLSLHNKREKQNTVQRVEGRRENRAEGSPKFFNIPQRDINIMPK